MCPCVFVCVFIVIILVVILGLRSGCFQVLIFCWPFFFFVACGERRTSWMVSFCNFSSCKMRTTLSLWLKWCLSSLKILRGFSKISPLLCECYWSLFVSFTSLVVLRMLFAWQSLLLIDDFEKVHDLPCYWDLLFLSRDQQGVDFRKVDAHVHQLKGSSSRYEFFIKANQKC